MVLLCVVHENGKPRLTPAGAPENRFMLIPSADCEIIDTWTVGGLRGTGSHDVLVRDVFVPNSYGSGFTDPYVLPEPRYRIPPFSRVIRRDGARDCPNRDRHLWRDCRREDAAAHDANAPRHSRRTHARLSGGIA